MGARLPVAGQPHCQAQAERVRLGALAPSDSSSCDTIALRVLPSLYTVAWYHVYPRAAAPSQDSEFARLGLSVAGGGTTSTVHVILTLALRLAGYNNSRLTA